MKRTDASAEFEQKWRALCSNNDLIPEQSSFDPIEFKKFLSRLMILRMDPERRLSEIKLMGDHVREGFRFDERGLNFNNISIQEQDQAHVDRQAAYHDHPVGRVAWIDVFKDEQSSALYEVTYLPIWGKEGERLVYSYVWPVDMSVSYRVRGERVSKFETISEEFIDIGKGFPHLSTGFDAH